MKADMSSFKPPLPKTNKEAYSRNKHGTSNISLTSSLKRNIIFQSTSILGFHVSFRGLVFRTFQEKDPILGERRGAAVRREDHTGKGLERS